MRIGKNRKSRNRRRALLLATALTPMCVSIGFAATNDSWTNSAGGTWDLATNWSLGVAPESNSYNAIVALVPASPYTVNIVDSFPVAAITVNSTKATVLQSAGTITTGTINLDAGTYTLGTGSNIGTIANATVNLGGGTLNIVNADLNNVAVTGGSLTVPGSYALYLQGGLAVGTLNAGNYATIYFDGNQTENNTVINSTGMNAVIKLGSPSSSSSNSTLTLGSNASLVGPFEIYNYINTGGYSLVNNGTINSNSSGNATYVETTTCINNGLAEATSGGTLEIDSTNFTNNGTLSVAAGCKLTVYSPNLVQNGTLITATGSQTSINDGTTTFSGGTVQNSGSLTITGPSTLKQTGSAVTVGGAVMVAPSSGDASNFTISSGSLTCQAGATIGSAGAGTFTQSSGSSSFTGALSAGNTGVLTAGTGSGTINISGGSLYADTVLLGSTAGGAGAMNISGSGSVTIGGGAHLNDITITGGTLTVLNTTPPVGEDAELHYALVGGYLTNGALNVNGGVVTSPLLKLGITNGNTGSFTQSAGSATFTTMCVGCDGTLTAGAGTGIANVSGGALYASTLLLGSTAGGSGSMTVSGTGSVTVGGGAHLNDLTVNGGTVTVLNATPPAGEDPELYQALVGGYLSHGALAVTGGVVTSPYAKFGVTSGQTGTFSQSGGTVTVGTLCLGSDRTSSSGSGIGMATVSGGTLSIGKLIISSSAGGVGTLAISGSPDINATATFNSGTITQSGGTTVMGPISGTGMVSIAGGSFSAVDIRQRALNLNTGATVTIPSNPAGPDQGSTVNVITDLYNNSGSSSLTSGTLDLRNNALIVNDAGESSSVIAAVVNAENFNATTGVNRWNRAGINSSSAAANVSNYALGYLTGSDITNLGSTSFEGQPITSNATVVSYTLIGDTELRGTVDGTDYNNVLANYDAAGDWSRGNFYNESIVSGDDYNAVLNAYDVAASGGAKGLKPAITRSLSPALSPVATSGTFHLEVNTTSGDVVIFNDSTSSAPLTLYNIVDGSQPMIPTRWPRSPVDPRPTTRRGHWCWTVTTATRQPWLFPKVEWQTRPIRSTFPLTTRSIWVTSSTSAQQPWPSHSSGAPRPALAAKAARYIATSRSTTWARLNRQAWACWAWADWR
jgi:hypothetical protein